MSTGSPAENVEVFKAGSNKWFAWLSWLVAGSGILVTVFTGGPAALLGTAPLVLLAFLGWLLFWKPSVAVHDGGITLENPFRSILVPWPALVNVDTRYALTLITPGKSYASWAAPAPGIWGGRNARPEDLQGLPGSSYGPGGSVRPGDLKTTDSGEAARIVRARWQELIDSGRLEQGRAETTPVTVTFHWAAIGAVVLLAGLSYWSVAVL
jgi:hypothetical protein